MEQFVHRREEFFQLRDIFSCGQAFRWKVLNDGSYRLIAKNRVLRLLQKGQDIYFYGTEEEEFAQIWSDYFDFSRDYSALRKQLAIDSIMCDAMEYGRGIRILQQEPFETIITFILSANSNIGRIMNSVEEIAKRYGRYLTTLEGEACFGFPDAHTLAQVQPQELREFAKVGYRDRYVVEAAQMIARGEVCPEDIYTMDLDRGKKELMRLPGVGEKVADCILLFAYHRRESFPVDVWIARVMEELYFHRKVPRKKVAELGREIFGDNAGFANQYLFYYGREHQLGKES